MLRLVSDFEAELADLSEEKRELEGMVEQTVGTFYSMAEDTIKELKDSLLCIVREEADRNIRAAAMESKMLKLRERERTLAAVKAIAGYAFTTPATTTAAATTTSPITMADVCTRVSNDD